MYSDSLQVIHYVFGNARMHIRLCTTALSGDCKCTEDCSSAESQYQVTAVRRQHFLTVDRRLL